MSPTYFEANTQRAERILIISVLALLIWLPLPMGSNRDWAIGLFVCLVGLLSLGWYLLQHFGLLYRSHSKSAAVTRTPLMLLCLVQAWVGLQWLGSFTADSAATFRSLLLGVSYCLLFALIIQLFNTRKHLTLLLAVLVLSGTIQAFWGAYMTLSGTEWLLFGPKINAIGSASGTFINRNHLAGYLEITMACSIGLLLALRDGKPFNWVNTLSLLIGPKARLRLALIIMVIALVLTRSRSGNFAFFTSLLVVGGLYVLLEKRHRLRNLLILASIILIDLLIISQYFGLEQLGQRLIHTQINLDVSAGVALQSTENRSSLVHYGVAMLQEAPLIGIGAGSFEAAFQRWPGSELPEHFDHLHNDYLEFAIEYGVPVTLILAAFVVLALMQALRALRNHQSSYRSGVGFGATMGIVALLIHSATDFNLQIPANAASFVVLCAIAFLANSHKHNSPLQPQTKNLYAQVQQKYDLYS